MLVMLHGVGRAANLAEISSTQRILWSFWPCGGAHRQRRTPRKASVTYGFLIVVEVVVVVFLTVVVVAVPPPLPAAFSLAHVFGPTMPSTSRPAFFWKARTALSVAGPN